MTGIDIIAKMIGGAATGYITNSIAIKMLFKKYGPVGGIVLKTKDEFIKNISQLVERDIINHNTLNEILNNEEFNLVLEEIIENIVDDYAYHYTAEQKWMDIPRFENSAENVIEIYKSQKGEMIEQFLPILTENIYLNELLGEEQIEYFSEQTFNLILDILKDTSIVEDFLIDFYKTNRFKNMSEYIPSSVLNKIRDNLSSSLKDVNNELKTDYNQEIDSILETIYSELELKDILKEVEKKLKKKTLSQLLGEDKAKSLFTIIINHFKNVDKRKIKISVYRLFNTFKKVDMSIDEIIPEEIWKNLELFLNTNLNTLIHSAISWLDKYSPEIENIIQETIEEVLEDGSGFANELKKMLYYNYKDNLLNKFQMSSLMSKVVEKNDFELLGSKLIDGIRVKSLGEIVRYIEEKNIISIDEIVDFIYRQLNQLKSDKFLEAINTEISNLAKFDLTCFFEENIKSGLFKKIKEVLYNGDLIILLQNYLININPEELKLNSFIETDEIISKINQANRHLLQILAEHQYFLKERASFKINHFLRENRISYLFSEQTISRFIADNEPLTDYLYKQKDLIKSRKITEIYDNLKRINLSQVTISFIEENLEMILAGNVEKIVADNLSTLNEEEIQEKIEDFMGTELKPITGFGALLGLIAGLGLYFGTSLTSGTLPAETELLTSIFTYGFVGYLTNVIALKMIFRPYHKKYFLGLKVPMTPGVVSKNKERFAKSMGDFIEKELLESESVNALLKNRRQEFEDLFIEKLSADNYQLLEKILTRNSQFIVEKIYDYIVNNNQKWSKNIIKRLKQIKVKDLNLDLSEIGLDEKLIELEQSLTSYLFKLSKSNKHLEKLIPSYVSKDMFEKILNMVVRKISSYQGKGAIKFVLGNLSLKQLSDTQLSSILPGKINFNVNDEEGFFDDHNYIEFNNEDEDSLNGLYNLFSNYIKDQLLNKVYVSSFSKEKIKNFMSENHFLEEEVIPRLINYLKSEKKEIEKIIIKEVNSLLEDKKTSGNFMDKLGFVGLKTAYNAINVEDTIAEVTDRLISVKIPQFFDDKIYDIKKLVDIIFEEKNSLKNRSILENISKEKLNDYLGDIIKTCFEDKQIVSWTDQFLNNILHILGEIDLQTILDSVLIEDMFDIYDLFEEESSYLEKNIFKNLETNKDDILNNISPEFNKIIKRIFMEKPVNIYFEDIEKEDFSHLTSNLRKNILSQINENSYFSGDDFKEITPNYLGDYLNLDLLEQDLTFTFNQLLNNNLTRNIVENEMEDFFINNVSIINQAIEEPVKDFFLKIITESTLDSFQEHFYDLMDVLNLKEIAEKEVNKMDPAEIENLFYSFAGRYFTRLKLYGWLGSGIGGIAELISLFT